MAADHHRAKVAPCFRLNLALIFVLFPGHDLIEQTSDRRLILGLAGQQIVGHFDFYSAFATPDEYQVNHEGRPIGTLPATALPRERDHLVLGGRRWEVARIRHERKEILVVPASGRKPPQFVGGGGEIHRRVRQEMRGILLDDRPIDYLNDSAARLLADARLTARESDLATSAILQTGDQTSLWFTWTGTKAQRVLLLMARIMGIDATSWGFAIEFRLQPADVRRHYTELLKKMPSHLVLATLRLARFRGNSYSPGLEIGTFRGKVRRIRIRRGASERGGEQSCRWDAIRLSPA